MLIRVGSIYCMVDGAVSQALISVCKASRIDIYCIQYQSFCSYVKSQVYLIVFQVFWKNLCLIA